MAYFDEFVQNDLQASQKETDSVRREKSVVEQQKELADLHVKEIQVYMCVHVCLYE